MEDKKVGHHFTLIQPGQEFAHYYPILMPFIEKIVEVQSYWLQLSNVSYFSENALVITLERYGISKDEWDKRILVK